MSLATACPKPEKVVKVKRSWADGFRDRMKAMTPTERAAFFAKTRKPRKPIARGTKPIPKVNAKRQARRMKSYRAHLASAYWREIRAQAFKRDRGLCWCPDCVQGRKDGVADAFEPIEAWFDTRGRPHGFDTHHTTYVRFGRELLEDVLTMKPAHHRRLEASTGIRKRFLKGAR